MFFHFIVDDCSRLLPSIALFCIYRWQHTLAFIVYFQVLFFFPLPFDTHLFKNSSQTDATLDSSQRREKICTELKRLPSQLFEPARWHIGVHPLSWKLCCLAWARRSAERWVDMYANGCVARCFVKTAEKWKNRIPFLWNLHNAQHILRLLIDGECVCDRCVFFAIIIIVMNKACLCPLLDEGFYQRLSAPPITSSSKFLILSLYRSAPWSPFR